MNILYLFFLLSTSSVPLELFNKAKGEYYKDKENSRKIMEKILKEYPDFPQIDEVHFFLGEEYRSRFVERVIKHKLFSRYIFALGIMPAEAKRSIHHYSEFIKISKDDTRKELANKYIADILFLTRNFDQAEMLYKNLYGEKMEGIIEEKILNEKTFDRMFIIISFLSLLLFASFSLNIIFLWKIKRQR